MHRFQIILAVLAALVFSAGAGAEAMKVVRRNGPALIGEVAQRGEFYEITTKAGLIIVPQAEVVSVQQYVSFEEEYARRLRELPGEDLDARYRLAAWCRSQGRLGPARDELRKILNVDPDNDKAAMLLQLVEEEADALARRKTPADRVAEALAGMKLVSADDIQAIRRSELRSSDKVKIVFRNNVLRRFIETVRESGAYKADDIRRFYSDLKPVQKAIEILDALPDRKDLHRDILILSNPQAITLFKRRLWPLLEKGCASAQCHGGPAGAGKLKLINTRMKTDEVYYTNFLLISSYRNLDGRMLDRAHPERSLLLDYSLPPAEGRKRHPGGDVDIFQSDQDIRYKLIDTWIRELITPFSGYDVQFELPGRTRPPAGGSTEKPERPEEAQGAATPVEIRH